MIESFDDTSEHIWDISDQVPTSMKVVGPAKWLLLTYRSKYCVYWCSFGQDLM